MTGRGLWITVLIVPPLAFVALFIVYPIISAFAYAFFDWQGLKRLDFVGLENFHTVLFVEPYRSWTLNAFRNNIIVFFALMVLQNGLGFILAYALWRELPGARFHRLSRSSKKLMYRFTASILLKGPYQQQRHNRL